MTSYTEELVGQLRRGGHTVEVAEDRFRIDGGPAMTEREFRKRAEEIIATWRW